MADIQEQTQLAEEIGNLISTNPIGTEFDDVRGYRMSGLRMLLITVSLGGSRAATAGSAGGRLERQVTGSRTNSSASGHDQGGRERVSTFTPSHT